MVPQIPWFPPSLNMCSCDPALKKKKPAEQEMCFGHVLTSTQDTITGRRSQNHKDSDADDKFAIIPRLCNLRGQIKRGGFMVSDLERPSAVKERGAVFSESLTTKKKETDARFGLFLCCSWLAAQLRGESCIITHHVLCLCAQGS